MRENLDTTKVQLLIYDNFIHLTENSWGGATLDEAPDDSEEGVWYEFYAKCDGADIEVWRREKGTTAPMTKILETDSTTVTTAEYFSLNGKNNGSALDDLVLLALDGDTLEEETFAYNAGNEMTAQTVNGDTLTFAYDQFGRMTSKTDGTATADYYYHYGDKLTKVASSFSGEGTVTYTYGGDQKRRSRAVSGGDTIKYRYDQGWTVLNEENGSGTLEATYVHHPGKQIGTVLATSAGSTASSGTWNYYFQDAIGSTRGLWDQDGLRIGKYEYSPFGGKYADHGEDITRKFTGHDWDSDARLYYTAYRYYSPDSNRWLTRDPLGMVDGPNVYAYVVNNPVAVWDALGQVSHIVIAGILGAMLGAVYGYTVSGGDLETTLYSAVVGAAGAVGITTVLGGLLGIGGLGRNRRATQWGGKKFEPGSWVHLGERNFISWLKTASAFKYPYSSGVTRTISAGRLAWPHVARAKTDTAWFDVLELFLKGLTGERIIIKSLLPFLVGLSGGDAYGDSHACD